MKSLAVFSSLALAACVGAVLCIQTAESQDKQQPTLDDGINRLLVERRETLRQLLDVVRAHYEAGQTTVNNVIRAQNGLLDAELELARTHVERIRIHEMRVSNLRDLENALERQQASGAATIDKLLAAKAARLEAEIEVLRAQAARD